MDNLKLLLASGNAHKAEEIERILKLVGGDTPAFKVEAAPEKVEVVEDGETLWENSKLKAYGYFNKFKRPTLADDSGLFVEALPEELGVRSARFEGAGLSDQDRARLLLKKLEGVQDWEKRKACFKAVLCVVVSPEEEYFFEGQLKGYVAKEYDESTSMGFGYDPVFIPEKFFKDGDFRSIAQHNEWKQLNSHRGKALRDALKFVANL